MYETLYYLPGAITMYRDALTYHLGVMDDFGQFVPFDFVGLAVHLL